MPGVIPVNISENGLKISCQLSCPSTIKSSPAVFCMAIRFDRSVWEAFATSSLDALPRSKALVIPTTVSDRGYMPVKWAITKEIL